ncbi:MAG TPA: hypothetical protein VKA59_10185 [Vicinamibacterales bacterium]|nr:hypothetical protein [Vicinamibacterales bacterium]
MRAILHRIAATFRRGRSDDRLDEEVRAHLELLAADYDAAARHRRRLAALRAVISAASSQ